MCFPSFYHSLGCVIIYSYALVISSSYKPLNLFSYNKFCAPNRSLNNQEIMHQALWKICNYCFASIRYVIYSHYKRSPKFEHCHYTMQIISTDSTVTTHNIKLNLLIIFRYDIHQITDKYQQISLFPNLHKIPSIK